MPRGRGRGPQMSNEKAKDFKGTMKKLMAYLSAYKIGMPVSDKCGILLCTGVHYDGCVTEADVPSEKRNL